MRFCSSDRAEGCPRLLLSREIKRRKAGEYSGASAKPPLAKLKHPRCSSGFLVI